MAQMWVLFFVIQALLHSALGKATGSSINVGIFGGKQIEIQDAPYMAALFYNETYTCVGSIVHDYFILTTVASCCASAVNKVHIGSSDVYHNGTTINVDYRVIHENYDPETFNNNICLLKLEKRVPVNCTVTKIKLEQASVSDGSVMKITGWGMTEKKPRSYPGVLRQAEVPAVSEKKCRTLFPKKTDNSFCAGSRGKDFCEGDVGAPLVFNNRLAGLASVRGGLCGQVPQLYTKVSSFGPWIKRHIEEVGRY